jgi:hypothetical protein
MRSHILAAAMLVTSSSVFAQAAPAPKPVARADFLKNVDSRFNTVDANHDGNVTTPELAAEQQRELGQAKTRLDQQLQTKFKQLDTNKDGQLSLTEFRAIAPPLRASENSDQILQRLDANHDGKVSVAEWRAPELAKFNKVDANHDGVVTPQEIKAAAGQK